MRLKDRVHILERLTDRDRDFSHLSDRVTQLEKNFNALQELLGVDIKPARAVAFYKGGDNKNE